MLAFYNALDITSYWMHNSLIFRVSVNEQRDGVKALKVSVRFFTSLREIVNKKEESLEFAEGEKVTVGKVLEILAQQYGKDFVEYVYDAETREVRGFLQFLINGKSASSLNGLETELEDCDVLAILPPVGGG